MATKLLGSENGILFVDSPINGFLANTVQQQGQPEEAAPAWFGAAMEAALTPLTADVKDNTRQLRKLARMTAIVSGTATFCSYIYLRPPLIKLFNESRTGGSSERYEIVYFPNLEDPTLANVS